MADYVLWIKKMLKYVELMIREQCNLHKTNMGVKQRGMHVAEVKNRTMLVTFRIRNMVGYIV